MADQVSEKNYGAAHAVLENRNKAGEADYEPPEVTPKDPPLEDVVLKAREALQGKKVDSSSDRKVFRVSK